MGNENAIPDVLGTKKKKPNNRTTVLLWPRCQERWGFTGFFPSCLKRIFFFTHLNVIVLLYGSGKETEYLIMADSLSVRSDVFEFWFSVKVTPSVTVCVWICNIKKSLPVQKLTVFACFSLSKSWRPSCLN